MIPRITYEQAANNALTHDKDVEGRANALEENENQEKQSVHQAIEFVEQAMQRTNNVWKDMQVQKIHMVKNGIYQKDPYSNYDLGEEQHISMQVCVNRTNQNMIMLDSGCSHRPVANKPQYLLESTSMHQLTLSVANQAMKYADLAGHLTGELTDNQGRRWLVMWTNGGCESSFPLSLGAPRPIYRDENGTTIHDVDFKNLSMTLRDRDMEGHFDITEMQGLPFMELRPLLCPARRAGL